MLSGDKKEEATQGKCGSSAQNHCGAEMAAALLQLSLCFVILSQLFPSTAVAQDSGRPRGCPPIVSRSRWNARAPTGRQALRYPLPRVFIHHTETPSCHSMSSCAARVRSIQHYHMNTRGWWDIGYNFLVGEDGNVYEGRGWNNMGAHVRGHNRNSIGIAIIGNFNSRKPNHAALWAATQLIRCGVLTQGKLSRQYSLHGHRDGGSTSCPGNALYRDLRGGLWSHYGGRV